MFEGCFIQTFSLRVTFHQFVAAISRNHSQELAQPVSDSENNGLNLNKKK
jgi:hypothetical protein